MIVNKTINDKNVIHETTRKMGSRAYVYCTILSVILALVIVFEFLTNKFENFLIFGFITLAGGLLIWEFALKKIKNSEIRSMNQIKEIYGEDFYESTISFGEEVVIVETKTTTREIKRSEIEKNLETKNLFIIYYSGKSYLIVAKKGFVEGSEEDLRKYLA